MSNQILLTFCKAGGAVYTVPGGNFVAHNGRILAIANPDGDMARLHFRQPLEEAGIAVIDWPQSEEEAGLLLGVEPPAKWLQQSLLD